MELSILNKNIIYLKFINGIGNKTIIEIINLVNELYTNKVSYKLISKFLNDRQKKAFLEAGTIWGNICRIEKDLVKNKINTVNYFDSAYPLSLKQIFSPPVILFYKGNFEYDYHRSLSIVGTRKYTPYGKEICRQFIPVFGENKFSIVSGLALGIDAIAHKEALKSNCKCIAVVGQGLNYVYPYENKSLYAEILEANGCIISESFPHENLKHPSAFPYRNRIIAGLSRGTLVVEAAEKSGSLITARSAFDESRQVFAVPVNVLNKQNTGCNWLIKQDIAKMVTEAEDIIKEYDIVLENIDSKRSQLQSYSQNLNPEQKSIFDAISLHHMNTDELSIFIHKNIEEVMVILSEMELEGIIQLDEENYWKMIM